MAIRPIFIAQENGFDYVRVEWIEFEWHPGFAPSQKKKNVIALHSSAKQQGFKNVLEVSSKSLKELGVQLSAFNLTFRHPHHHEQIRLESAFQGSKVFTEAGPFPEAYGMQPRDARQLVRTEGQGTLVGFNFFGQEWPLEPTTLFYNWLYLNCLYRSEGINEDILAYSVFTDIEFNPKRSINCQAYSAALYVSLYRRKVLHEVVGNRELFIEDMMLQKDWILDQDLMKHHRRKNEGDT